MRRLARQRIRQFRKTVYAHFLEHGRSLPWRLTKDPYRILVSEIMLQQTQVDRVIPKYKEFLKKFPTIQTLARAPLSKVLWTWSGLGYNRRALALKRCAARIVEYYDGRIPSSIEALNELPGIGRHTAGALCAFAFNQPVVFIETNIRSVYLHHFFPKRKNVSDSELVPLIEHTLDRKNPRRWYSALMDYGSALKKQVANPSRKSAHYVKQSRFEGSHRELRGVILRLLIGGSRFSKEALAQKMQIASARLHKALDELMTEGFIVEENGKFSLGRM